MLKSLSLGNCQREPLQVLLVLDAPVHCDQDIELRLCCLQQYPVSLAGSAVLVNGHHLEAGIEHWLEPAIKVLIKQHAHAPPTQPVARAPGTLPPARA